MNDKKCANGIPEKYLNKIKALEHTAKYSAENGIEIK